MGPNSGSSNSASEPAATADLSINSLSPTLQHQQNLHHLHREQHSQNQHQHQHQSLHQQLQPQQHNLNVSAATWNSLPISLETGSAQSNLSNNQTITSSNAKIAAAVQLHQQQVFANHYSQSLQQSRSTAPQHFYNWYN